MTPQQWHLATKLHGVTCQSTQSDKCEKVKLTFFTLKLIQIVKKNYIYSQGHLKT